MKIKTINRIVALVLSVIMVAAAFATMISVAATADPDPVDVCVQNGTGNRQAIRVGNACSYRAIVNGEFTGFAFNIPTWEKTNSYATLYLYKWQGDYVKTVNSTPIASKSFTPLTDNNENWVEFKAQPAGEYLFHIDNVSTDVGVWANTSPSNSKGFLYINGVEFRGEPDLKIRFKEKLSEPFGTCQTAVAAQVYPYTPQSGTVVNSMTGPYGVRLNMTAPFVGVTFQLASYGMNDMEVDMNVYAWKGTYHKTVSVAPVASDRVRLVDGSIQGFMFNELPAGDYLFVIENVNKASAAVCAYSSVSNFKGNVFRDGVQVSANGNCPYMQVIFSKNQSNYFTDCVPRQDIPTGSYAAPPVYTIPSDSLIYTHPVMPDTWVFTDGLGRVSLTNAEVGNLRDDKTLAMFYWSWHTDLYTVETPKNLNDLSNKYPEAMRNYYHPLWSDKNSFWWNESIYGYYRSDDPWVLRKQAELLANAGVDVVFTDNTNADITWRTGYHALMETWSEARDNGLETPKVSFMLPFFSNNDSGTRSQVRAIYEDIFRPGKFQNVWFYWDSKPMIMARSEAFNTGAAIDNEIKSFFTFRKGKAEYPDKNTANGYWGWLSTFPQALFYKNSTERAAGIVEQMTVGVALNHNYSVNAIAPMNGDNIIGRSYTTAGYHREAGASKWGYNFDQQFNYALTVDPKVIFVTGWNEFRVTRHLDWPYTSTKVQNSFPDQFNDEYSRDIEPTKGELQDHYYYQLVNFARRYKGARPIPTPSGEKTIDLNAGYSQWKDVSPYFGAYIGNTEDRNSYGYGDLFYSETSGRNDIIGAQVSRDSDYLYFLVECAQDITPYTDSLWMNLYLDVNQGNQGWNTFDYVVGKTAGTDKTLVLEKFTATNNYAATRKIADVEYKVDGRYMTVKIAKASLGITSDAFTVNFAWTDNVHDEGDYSKFSGDIMDFYVSGDVAPGGRFKFSYVVATADSGETTEPTETETTETPTEEPTTPAETQPVETPTQDVVDEPKSGCKSSVAATAAAAVITAAAAAVALGKKED